MHYHCTGKKELRSCSEIEESMSNSNYSWLYDELAEEVDQEVDPDYMLPEAEEEVGENYSTAITDSRRYNLRPRQRHPTF